MKAKLPAMFFMSLCCLVFPLPSGAEAPLIWGPVKIEAEQGKPKLHEHFFVSAVTGPDFVLEIQSGNESGGHRVSSAVVRLNGKNVAVPRDFNKKTAEVVRPVELFRKNRLEAEVRGAPGSFLTLSIRGSARPVTASLTATPEAVSLGDGVVLEWSTSGATRCMLEPGAMEVPLEGSLEVRPVTSTSYTLTAEGPGGTVAVIVVVEVNAPSPTVHFAVSPQSIIAGESATLTWDSSNGVNARIEPGIGEVPLSGSLEVSPLETTTYVLRVDGPGGFTEEQVVLPVQAPAPFADLTADPDTVTAGQAVTLSWSTEHALECRLEPDIGDVPAAGALTVHPGQTTTYTLTAVGPGGAVSAQTSVTVLSSISIRIIHPVEGAIISQGRTLVEGVIEGRDGEEWGVSVNGVPAVVFGDHFVANNVGLANGENRIEVTAVDSLENVFEEASHVIGDLGSSFVETVLNFDSGSVPFECLLRADGNFEADGPMKVEAVNSAGIEIRETSEPGEFTVTVLEEGIHYIDVEAGDGSGNLLSDRVAVVGWEKSRLEEDFQAKWASVREALRNRDVSAALEHFSPGSREKYRVLLEALEERLPDIAARLQDIQLIYAEDRVAKCRFIKNELVQGEIQPVTYHAYFVRDPLGRWRIHDF